VLTAVNRNEEVFALHVTHRQRKVKPALLHANKWRSWEIADDCIVNRHEVYAKGATVSKSDLYLVQKCLTELEHFRNELEF